MEEMKAVLDYMGVWMMTGGERAALLTLAAIQATEGIEWVLPAYLARKIRMSHQNAREMLSRPRVADIVIAKKVRCKDGKWRMAYKVKVP